MRRIAPSVLGFGLLLLAACESLPSAGRETPNYAAPSPLGAGLSSGDQRALAVAFERAITAGRDGERFDWRGKGAFGWVKARELRLGGLKPGANDRPSYPKGLHLAETFETEGGVYALTRNANVRNGPSTDEKIIAELTSGTGVEVIGRVIGKPWSLVEIDGKVKGYVHESLMIRAPGTETAALAGGPRKRAVACRSFEQRLTVGEKSAGFEGVACEEDGGWTLKPRAPDAPVTLY